MLCILIACYRKAMLWNYQLEIFRQIFGLVAFDKARDNNFVVRDEGTSSQWTTAQTEENVSGDNLFRTVSGL